MAIVRENIPRAGGASPIAQMLAQRAQPPAMAAPPRPPLNGMRAPAPPMAAPAAPPPVAGGMPQTAVPAAIKAVLMARMFGGAGGPGGAMGGGGAPPIGRA
jgi:hypothetical protein